jgi:hypothetical protein
LGACATKQFAESPAAKAAKANALNIRDPELLLSPMDISLSNSAKV